jgi:hypothetical protein
MHVLLSGPETLAPSMAGCFSESGHHVVHLVFVAAVTPRLGSARLPPDGVGLGAWPSVDHPWSDGADAQAGKAFWPTCCPWLLLGSGNVILVLNPKGNLPSDSRSS